MSIDPAVGFALDQASRTADRLGDLERRVAAMERGQPVVQVGSGAPTTSPRDGTLYVDTAAVRLYVRSAGAWRYAALT